MLDVVIKQTSIQTIGGQFEEMLSQLNGSSTGEWHLEMGLALPATWWEITTFKNKYSKLHMFYCGCQKKQQWKYISFILNLTMHLISLFLTIWV